MRRIRTGEWLAGWGQDLRIACRQFRRAPGFVTTTVLVLMLGVGAATAIFSVVRGVLLRPLAYSEADRIAQVWEVNRAGHRLQFSDPDFDDMRARTQSFAALAEFSNSGPVSVSGDITAVRASLVMVSHDFFRILAVKPVIGRTFVPEEERRGGPPAAVLSWGFWQRVFGGSRDVAGRRLTVGDHTYTVVGVMGPALDFPVGTDLWVSREMLFPRLPSRTAHNFQVITRLSRGATLATAQHEASTVARALAAQYGSETTMEDAALVPLRDQLTATARPTLLVLLVASLVLLLIAWANVANLLVARLTAQQGEFAVRVALGASPVRLLRQCLSESLLLATAGGTLGVALAAVGTRMLVAIDPTRLPRAGDVHLDPLVLLFALCLIVGTAAALAILTSWRATRSDVREVLSGSGRTTSASISSARFRQILVTGQVAMTVVLLIAAGLLGRSFVALLSVDPGFRTDRRVVLDLAIDADDSTSEVRRAAFYHELLSQLSTLPGVAAVGAANAIPLDPASVGNGTFIEMTSPDEKITLDGMAQLFQDHTRTGDAEFRLASGGYFAAMHIPLLNGRTFDERDRPDAVNVAVISTSLAKARWPGQSPIGRWIQFGNMDGDLRPFMIVGVVGDVREAGLDAPPRPTFYADYLQRPVTAEHMNVVLAGTGDAGTIAATAQSIVRALRPDVPPRVRTMTSIVSSSVAGRRLALLLVGAFGAAALILSACGLYGVISYFVAQRSRELSIRIALGAGRQNIASLVLREGAALTFGGLLIGSVAALAATRVVSSLLYGVGTADPVTFGGMLMLVAAVALTACWIPAHRASRADAIDALRAG